MAEGRAKTCSLQVHLDYAFDRLREPKLAQAYEILVPGRERAAPARAVRRRALMKMAAIYARVSSEQQREEHTIASQTAALIEFAASHDLQVPRSGSSKTKAIAVRRSSDRALSGYEISPPKVRSKPFSPTRPIG